jgi:hypothetical protein
MFSKNKAWIMFIILFLASAVFAQGMAPEWIDESWRDSRYPKSEWYTGFAMDMAKGQPDSKAYQATEKNAQSKLSESIVVTIQGSSTVQLSSKQTQKGETINTNYDQSIRTASNTILAKVDVKSYYDKNTGYIYAFAAVKKKDLANFYRSGINSLFTFADKEFAIAEQLTEQGKKKQALDRIYAIEDSLKNVDYWGSLLQAVEDAYYIAYIAKETALWQKANSAKIQLQNGTTVHLDISSDGYGDLNWLLRAQMQEKGCNCAIVEKKEDADYLVSIKTKVSRCNEASPGGTVFCWANAVAVVSNLKLGKPVNLNIPEAKGGWIKGNKDKATEEAFKMLAGSLAEKINQAINR